MEPQTLLFDTEKSAESYVHLYADEPGVPAGQSLWPAPIPVVGVSGAIGQGKTCFLLDIANGPVRRVDVPLEMMKLKPNGYRPIDTFTWFWSIVKSIPPQKFRVIALDVAEEIEQGVAEWVWENPLHFNTTRQQFIKMSGVYQGLVSSFWKSILMDITSRCETFAFANHIGQVFDSGGRAVAGKTKSKGRPVMKQSATLYISLHREKDAAGNLADRPAGVVDLSEGGKTRLMTKVVRAGVRMKVPVLPPRMPIATPQAIRDYFVNPPDYTQLAAQQRAPEHVMTADERVEAQMELARQQCEVERLKIDRIAEERKQAAGVSEPQASVVFENEPAAADHDGAESAASEASPAPSLDTTATDETPSVTPTAEPQPPAPAAVQSPAAGPVPAPATDTYRRPASLPADLQLSVRQLWEEFAIVASAWSRDQSDAVWKAAVLDRYGVFTGNELTQAQLAEIERNLVGKIEAHYAARGTPAASPFRAAELDAAA